MQGQHSAISAESIKTGVTNDERFEVISADIHGFGAGDEEQPARHDVLTCADMTCGHSDHGLSTAGKNFERHERAGDAYANEGAPLPESDVATNDERIAAGNVVDILEAVEEHAAGNACGDPKCRRCNVVDDRTLQREVKVAGGGGGSRGPKGKEGTAVCKVEGCGLTLCEHILRKSGKKRGPQPKKTSRVKTVAFKVTDASKNALQQAGIDGELINKLGAAVQNGLKYSDVDAFLESRNTAA